MNDRATRNRLISHPVEADSFYRSSEDGTKIPECTDCRMKGANCSIFVRVVIHLL